jgi:hypothetical protein
MNRFRNTDGYGIRTAAIFAIEGFRDKEYKIEIRIEIRMKTGPGRYGFACGGEWGDPEPGEEE